MRLQLTSDLHVERYPAADLRTFIDVCPDVDALLIAGDLGNPKLPTYEAFVKQASELYRRVVLVQGNHEPYGSTLEEATAAIRAIVGRYANVTLLDDEELVFAEQRLVVLGTRLWSHIPSGKQRVVQSMLNDYRAIRGFTPEHSSQLHAQHVAWLQGRLQHYKQQEGDAWRVVVLTHHLPSPELIATKYRGFAANCAFHSDLHALMDGALIQLWVSGHTHTPCDKRVQGVRCVVNPYAYDYEDRTLYQRALVVDLNQQQEQEGASEAQ